jgi:hypothetical protein
MSFQEFEDAYSQVIDPMEKLALSVGRRVIYWMGTSNDVDFSGDIVVPAEMVTGYINTSLVNVICDSTSGTWDMYIFTESDQLAGDSPTEDESRGYYFSYVTKVSGNVSDVFKTFVGSFFDHRFKDEMATGKSSTNLYIRIVPSSGVSILEVRLRLNLSYRAE